jgi:hypothetical protein
MKKYLWDFFGPYAERTARHFEQHLLEFLSKNELAVEATGLESNGHNHHAAFCIAPAQSQSTIETSLRPNRNQDQ